MPYLKAIDAQTPALVELAAKMWDEPETAFNEVKACKWISEYLTAQGFEVETGYVNLPTAIKATWGSGHPIIGILAEYDALPGMSQKQQTTKEPVVVGAPGQACGHNLLGMASVGAVLGMKAFLEEKKLPGTVVFYGCPAEEVLTGKAFMARNGAFRDIDLAFSWHGSTMNTITDADGVMTGLNSAIFHFKGRTAHAGGDPFNGRSALDAAELMSVGANYLREHVTSDVRIHYSYKEAGTAPNIVPDRAAVWYYVRAMSREAIEDTYDRLVKVAKGAAMMTETEVEIEFLGGCYNTLNNHVLAEVLHQAQLDVEMPVWTDEEKAFADALNKQSPTYEAMVAKGVLKEGHPICDWVNELQHNNGYGSTDVGDVQHIVPCTQIMTATCNVAAPGHSWQIAVCAGNSIGFKGMIYGAKVMADAAAKIYAKPELAEQAKAEFDEAMKGKTYKCPIPMEVPVPQPQQ